LGVHAFERSPTGPSLQAQKKRTNVVLEWRVSGKTFVNRRGQHSGSWTNKGAEPTSPELEIMQKLFVSHTTQLQQTLETHFFIFSTSNLTKSGLSLSHWKGILFIHH
jgi:hypothetical protein